MIHLSIINYFKIKKKTKITRKNKLIDLYYKILINFNILAKNIAIFSTCILIKS